MIVYRVHQSALCHESINGSDMVRVVEFDTPLVSAAPDLLAALKELTAGMWAGDGSSSPLVPGEQVARARAAIAKAEGKP